MMLGSTCVAEQVGTALASEPHHPLDRKTAIILITGDDGSFWSDFDIPAMQHVVPILR